MGVWERRPVLWNGQPSSYRAEGSVLKTPLAAVMRDQHAGVW